MSTRWQHVFMLISVQFSSVQSSRSVVSDSLRPHASTYNQLSSVQFSSSVVSNSLCDPMDCSTPGFPVHHQLPKFTQTHVHRVRDAIQPSHPVIPFSSRLQSFPASRSFPMSHFASGGQSIGASASTSVLP